MLCTTSRYGSRSSSSPSCELDDRVSKYARTDVGLRLASIAGGIGTKVVAEGLDLQETWVSHTLLHNVQVLMST
jgi:hypothetical protein